jgi:hypothetical protein
MAGEDYGSEFAPWQLVGALHGDATGPLIDRDAIATAMYLTPYHPDWEQCVWLADAVLAYLQEVLTPEALRPWEEVPGQIAPEPSGDDCGPSIRVVAGSDLYRRIFGEGA